MKNKNAETVRKAVREGYGKIATQGGSCCAPGSGCGSAAPAKTSCCGASQPDALAAAVGYSPADLAALPVGANMGLSCGNPTALASLQPGETVLDLGSGGGFDVFLAGPKVGLLGRVIGVDMTAEMLAIARANIPSYVERSGLDNVEFRLGEIEHLPLADNSVDVVISNCVINLSPDKPQVWREIARVLKPGGRVAVSDMSLLQPLPPWILETVEALVGCVAGATLVSETESMMRAAGLVEIELTPNTGYVAAMQEGQDPLYTSVQQNSPPETRLSDYITSLSITARLPAASESR